MLMSHLSRLHAICWLSRPEEDGNQHANLDTSIVLVTRPGVPSPDCFLAC